jgi:vancomycin permeability regulator SanA
MAILRLCRPAAIALALFIVLNAGATCAHPSLGAGRLLVNLPLPEPYLSLTLVAFALTLLFPARRSLLRWVELLVLGVFGAAVVGNIGRFYLLLGEGKIRTPLPIPFSALVLLVILAEILRISTNPRPARLPPIVSLLMSVIVVPAAFFLVVAAHIVTLGLTDYRGFGPVDAAVILGARVYADGTPSEALAQRLMTGIELGRQGLVRYLIMSGGTGESGTNEAEVMKRFARARGVPEEAILSDPGGITTFASAVNYAALVNQVRREHPEFDFRRVMVVSQYYHLARTKLIFERLGMTALTVPARVEGRFRANLSQLLRETVALPYYYLCCTFER